MSPLKMYDELAKWWPLLSPPDEYVDEVQFFLDALYDVGAVKKGTMLDIGSGGGSNAFLLKNHFTMTLVDLAPNMLDVSRAINPECEHIVGDMRTLRLGRQFDVVFIHDAIDYMLTEADLRQALETAYLHCKPGGIAIFVPDAILDTFESSTDHGGRDGDGRGLRYLEWSFDPDVTDTTYITDYVFMLREGDTLHIEHDQHECGLFSHDVWANLLNTLGFHSERRMDSYNREIFLALKPPT